MTKNRATTANLAASRMLYISEWRLLTSIVWTSVKLVWGYGRSGMGVVISFIVHKQKFVRNFKNVYCVKLVEQTRSQEGHHPSACAIVVAERQQWTDGSGGPTREKKNRGKEFECDGRHLERNKIWHSCANRERERTIIGTWQSCLMWNHFFGKFAKFSHHQLTFGKCGLLGYFLKISCLQICMPCDLV